MSKAIVILVTTSSKDEAKKIGQTLVDEGLVACCNIIHTIESIFKWQGKLNIENEALMICKTREELFRTVENRIKQLHSYEVPEIISLPVVQGSKSYLDWIIKETITNQ